LRLSCPMRALTSLPPPKANGGGVGQININAAKGQKAKEPTKRTNKVTVRPLHGINGHAFGRIGRGGKAFSQGVDSVRFRAVFGLFHSLAMAASKPWPLSFGA
jgi:hypothetical protein